MGIWTCGGFFVVILYSAATFVWLQCWFSSYIGKSLYPHSSLTDTVLCLLAAFSDELSSKNLEFSSLQFVVEKVLF